MLFLRLLRPAVAAPPCPLKRPFGGHLFKPSCLWWLIRDVTFGSCRTGPHFCSRKVPFQGAGLPAGLRLSVRVRSCEGEVFPARKSLLKLANPVNGGRSKPDWFIDSDVHRAKKRKNPIIIPRRGKCFVCCQYG